MLVSKSFSKLYLYNGFVDMRKQINGLAAFINAEMKLNPFEECLFIFSGKRRRTLKILYWDRNGFCMWQKTLEKDKFIWPKLKDQRSLEISSEQLKWLMEGYDIWRMKPHETLNYKYVS